MSEFTMPSLGADMESAVLMEWLVKEGDHVKKGQVIAEVETSKGIIEIEVFENGIVDKILIPEETECAVGTPLALIRSEDEASSTDQNSVHEEVTPESKQETEPLELKSSKVPSMEPEKVQSEEMLSSDESEVKEVSLKSKEEAEPLNFALKEASLVGVAEVEGIAPIERIKASPVARKMAHEQGVDLSEIKSKAGEVLQLHDLESTSTSEQKVSMEEGMRQAIAKAMSRSNAEIPHYYLSASINMTPALAWLVELNEKRSIRERILPAALLIRAVVLALGEVPELNGFWQEERHQISAEINPGIAISLRKGGLMTPALLNAHKISLDETMQKLDDLITRTRTGKLRGSEMTQQSITITNLGDLGVECIYGVIYPPQVAIIGFGRIMDSPWAEGDTLSVRKVIQVTIAGDHRATDGHSGALFLDKLNQFLQKPEELL